MTHLRLPKRAERCWEQNLAVPLLVAAARALCGAGPGASPHSTPHLSSQPGPLDSETSHKCKQPLSKGKERFISAPKLLALELTVELDLVCVNNPTITIQHFCLDSSVCGATFS